VRTVGGARGSSVPRGFFWVSIRGRVGKFASGFLDENKRGGRGGAEVQFLGFGWNINERQKIIAPPPLWPSFCMVEKPKQEFKRDPKLQLKSILLESYPQAEYYTSKIPHVVHYSP